MKILLLLLITATFTSVSAQIPENFDAAVSFHSVGTGTPSDDFLKKFYKKYKKTNKKLLAYKAAGCGREGEFYILFSTKGMKITERNIFLKDLKQLVYTQDKANKARNKDSGYLQMERKITTNEISHCRIPIVLWK